MEAKRVCGLFLEVLLEATKANTWARTYTWAYVPTSGFVKPFDISRGHECSHMHVYQLVHDFQKLFQLYGSPGSHTPFHTAVCQAV